MDKLPAVAAMAVQGNQQVSPHLLSFIRRLDDHVSLLGKVTLGPKGDVLWLAGPE